MSNLDVDAIVERMTLEEKAAICTGAGPWTTLEVARLGVPPMTVADGPHGLRRLRDLTTMMGSSLPATCFPTASCQAATWNTALIEELGRALAEEALALGVGVILGPGSNMKRTPLCGRNFEYFSEDPYLSGVLAAHYIDAVQSMGVGTSLKHFAANNQEFQRFSISADVDERTLREIYLTAFEMAVKEAHPWTVMCAYNRVNATYCSEHHRLLTDILREEWGFDGFVFSDWGAVHDRVAALQAGLDLEMPGPKPRRVEAVVDAVREGALDEAVLDRSVRRILRVVARAAQTPKGGEFDASAHHALARKIAAEGIVLLKNDGTLPLRDPGHVAVIGRAAKEPQVQGGGSSNVNPTQVDSVLDAVRALAPAAEVTYAPGYTAHLGRDHALIDQAVGAAESADVALLVVALPPVIESEGYDRPDLDLTPQQVALIQAVTAVQPRTVVVLNTGSAVAMADWIDGTAAVLEAWLMGQAGAGAVADVLFGRVNPSGKLAETFPLKLSDTPAHLNFPGELGEVRYGEGLFIGYRYYDAREMPVLFPFGHGLSYTTFSYDHVEVSASRFQDVEGLTVSVDVTNTGDLAGQEVVQLYVRDCESTLARPLKELKGFAKVGLQPGETKTLSFPLDFRAFAFYHPGHGRWITEDGEFELLIGASAADIRCTETVTLESTLNLPSLLDEESTLREWLDDPHGKEAIAPLYELLVGGMGAVAGDDEGSDATGSDPARSIMDMPLRSILRFGEDRLPMTPEEIVDALLEQVE